MRRDKKLNDLKLQREQNFKEMCPHRPQLNEVSKKLAETSSSRPQLISSPSMDFIMRREKRL